MNKLEAIEEIGKSLMEDAGIIARALDDGKPCTYKKIVTEEGIVEVAVKYMEVEK